MRAILIRQHNNTSPGDAPAVLPGQHPKLISPTIATGNHIFSHFWNEDINTAMLALPLVLQYIVNTSLRIGIVLKVPSILSEISGIVL